MIETHIPTALSRREDALLQRYARDKRVVEVGALLGHSTVILGDVASQVVSIDHHVGYCALPNDTWRLYNNNLHRYGVASRITPFNEDFRFMVNVPADFAFIDLDGTKETTLEAIRLARARFVGVHDFERQNCQGVADAVRASGYPIIERVDSLVILEKR